jgi:uncharacterized protein
MEKVKMFVKDLKQSHVDQFYDLILLENDGARAINISLGEKEADGIAMFLDSITPPRPMMYDILIGVMDRFALNVEQVVLSKFIDGYFFAYVVISNGEKTEQIDIRPSDAINLALRTNCPIYANEEILEQVGFDYCTVLDSEQAEEDVPLETNLEELAAFGVNMLEDLLKDAIEKEDYITASLLRDKIKKLSNYDK